MTERPGYFRQGFAVFVGTIVFLLIAFTLEKTGLERGYVLALTACALCALWIVAVLPASTTTASKYFFAAKKNRSTINGLAMMTSLAFPLLLMNGGSLFFTNPSFLVVVFIAIIIGTAFSSVLVARYFYESGAVDVSNLLIRRFDSALPARCLSIATGFAGLLLLICGMALLFKTITWFFAIGDFAAFCVIVGLVSLTAILGGANSNTRLAAVAAILLLTAFNLPLLLNSLEYANFPIGHISFGSDALSKIWDLEDQLLSLQIPIVAEILTASPALLAINGGQQVIAGIIIALSVVFFPSLLQQNVTALSAGDASSGSQKVILLFGFLGTSLAAHLAFTQFGLYQTLLGLTVSDARNAAPFLFSWGERSSDFVTLCGSVRETVSDLLTACEDGPDHLLTVQDIILNSELILPGSPDLTALPFAFTAFITSAIIISGIAFSSALVLATAKNIASAFYGSTQGVVASRQIFFTRILVIAMTLIAAIYVNYYSFDPVAVFFFAISILASVLVPAMLAALFIPQARSSHVTSAIFAGFIFAILYFVLSKYGVDFIPGSKDELQITLPGMRDSVPPEFSAIFAVPIGFATLGLAMLISMIQSPAPVQTVENDD